jgi:hypothetical protein
MEENYLQPILGTSAKNMVFTVHQNRQTQQYHVYYGLELFDVVPADKEDIRFKLMVAHMHIIGFTLTALQSAFAVDARTIKKWSTALKSGSAQKLQKALIGLGSNRKLTEPIQQFVRMRFEEIYPQDRYRYSSKIRQEIKQVFGEEISSETLRGLFKELKEQHTKTALEANRSERAEKNDLDEDDLSDDEDDLPPNPCDTALLQAHFESAGERGVSTSNKDNKASNSSLQAETASENRNADAVFYGRQWCSHPGLLLFSQALCSLQKSLPEEAAKPLTQWISQVLLGAANLEQTKLLSTQDLQLLLGADLLGSAVHQRNTLEAIASDPASAQALLRWNFGRAQGQKESDFFFDPHTKHYTGKQEILKGWCAKIRFADKILNADFAHTRKGQPIYLENTDNYEDLRQRFAGFEERFRQNLQIPPERELTWIIDRGIFSKALLDWVANSSNKHLITWEKGYQGDGWPDTMTAQASMIMERARNHSKDLRSYHFEWIEKDWPKNEQIRQLIVRATNPSGNTIEVSILCDDKERDASSIIRAMFDRWLQENDFKYLSKHFGIDEITSYQSQPYHELRESLEDRSVKNAAYLAICKDRAQEKKLLGQLLLKEKHAREQIIQRATRISELEALKNRSEEQSKEFRQLKAGQRSAQTYQKRRATQIEQSEQRLLSYEEELSDTLQEVSRLETLIERGMVRLRTEKKHLMDVIKITARNLFYQSLEPFRKHYDNFRDDHVWFRHLTQITGLIDACDQVKCYLIENADYPGSVHKVIEETLTLFNQSAPEMPDGSGRKLELILAQKSAFELAI